MLPRSKRFTSVKCKSLRLDTVKTLGTIGANAPTGTCQDLMAMTHYGTTMIYRDRRWLYGTGIRLLFFRRGGFFHLTAEFVQLPD
jgi:hypothetical protein